MCFGCWKKLSHQDSSYEYPQHMLWLRNKKNIFLLRILIWRPGSPFYLWVRSVLVILFQFRYVINFWLFLVVTNMLVCWYFLCQKFWPCQARQIVLPVESGSHPYIRETPKWVLLQTLKTQMKCSIMLCLKGFMRVNWYSGYSVRVCLKGYFLKKRMKGISIYVLEYITLENLCTRTAQSSRGVRSRRVHKIYYFGLLWSILWASTLQLLIFTMFFSFGIIA